MIDVSVEEKLFVAFTFLFVFAGAPRDQSTILLIFDNDCLP